MNIFPPSSPKFAIRIVDGDTLVGILREAHEASEAGRLLRRIRNNFPNSTLAEYDGTKWIPVDDEQLQSAIYLHTMYVMAELTRAGLPVAYWRLAPHQADRLEGTLHIDDVDEARKAIEAYAAVFGVINVNESEDDRASRLKLDVVWAGVRIELSTYTSKRHQATEPTAVGA